MGITKILGKNKDSKRLSPFARRGYFTNPFAIEELLHYVTRTRIDEARQRDLICYGVFGAASYANIGVIIQQFQYVQHVFQNERGRKMYHLVYSFSPDEEEVIGKDYTLAFYIGQMLALHFWNQGFQILYAVHDEIDKHLHIHLAMNSVNFVTGKKFHVSGNEEQTLKQIMNDIASNILAQYRSRLLYQQM